MSWILNWAELPLETWSISWSPAWLHLAQSVWIYKAINLPFFVFCLSSLATSSFRVPDLARWCLDVYQYTRELEVQINLSKWDFGSVIYWWTQSRTYKKVPRTNLEKLLFHVFFTQYHQSPDPWNFIAFLRKICLFPNETHAGILFLLCKESDVTSWCAHYIYEAIRTRYSFLNLSLQSKTFSTIYMWIENTVATVLCLKLY